MALAPHVLREAVEEGLPTFNLRLGHECPPSLHPHDLIGLGQVPQGLVNGDAAHLVHLNKLTVGRKAVPGLERLDQGQQLSLQLPVQRRRILAAVQSTHRTRGHRHAVPPCDGCRSET